MRNAPKPPDSAQRDSAQAATLLPLDNESVEHWSNVLADARLTAHRVEMAVPAPTMATDAFAIQRAVARRLHDTPGGWKTAGAGPGGLPLIAPLLQKTIHSSPASLKEPSDKEMILEVEFGLRLRTDFAEMDISRCNNGLELVDEVFVALELCCNRFVDPKPPLAVFLADGLANAGLVVGSGVGTMSDFRFSGRRVRLAINGTETAHTVTGPRDEDIAEKLLWLVRESAVHGGLASGAIVITGSLTGTTRIQPGDFATASIKGVGEAQIKLR